jgi:TIR domain/Pentapeptide repeats (8 copies)
MANPEHLAILNRGVEEWNEWRSEHPDVRPDLREAKLSGENLSGANLSEADLSEADVTRALFLKANLIRADLTEALLHGADFNEANLKWANLRRADFTGANLRDANLRAAKLRDANLRDANLTGADLRMANLSGADLRRADLSGTDLNWACLDGADFTGANAGGTIFASVDVSFAEGLKTIKHDWPSTVGIDTIYKSHGKIPEVFLRGCGVPDEFIAYIGSMVGRPIEYYSCFISYSTQDQEFADRLYADLQAKGVRCWFAPHDIKSGRKIHEQIDEAIRLHDRLLLILSEHSMSSEWVKTEIAKARRRETKEGKRVLFPVRLVGFERLRDWECFDGDTGKDSAREIREYFIPDFSNWKDHDSYRTAFDQLVQDLKAETAK